MMHGKETNVELPIDTVSSHQDLRGFVSMVRLVKVNSINQLITVCLYFLPFSLSKVSKKTWVETLILSNYYYVKPPAHSFLLSIIHYRFWVACFSIRTRLSPCLPSLAVTTRWFLTLKVP